MPIIICNLLALFLLSSAQAAVGLLEIPARQDAPALSIFYPAQGENQPVLREKLGFSALPNAIPRVGNGRLIVISPGSGSSPWVHADLSALLVEAGFVVAIPTHPFDNHQSKRNTGPTSWKTRPGDMSASIDALAKDRRFAGLKLDKVGMLGGSAGGHTALTLAGGRWSPARLVKHCDTHIREDFNACAGLVFSLNGDWLDAAKIRTTQAILHWRFNEPREYSHFDQRIAAIVAVVPYVVTFDLATLAQPKVPLALITARRDVWLHPQFHSDPLLKICRSCVLLHEFKTGGHGAMLSPIRRDYTGLAARLINDPPGFDRKEVLLANRKVRDFFVQRLTGIAL
ncbi:alpha/beta hydrolase family protein [Chitinibacter sp. S2-10]|uniref:alpha/beta hydrolase family protein n=1 Tax=Chitinibacter sp. S2-10 TaxID=3373597 RepID=UPI0039772D8A